MTAFRAYIEPIFLYNCEIWTITSSQAETTINPFQQCLLRTYVLNVEWPNTVRNEEVYRRTKAIEWSTTIQKRRLQWVGSVIRRDSLTTARRAFNYAIAPYQRHLGKPVSTWLSIIRSRIKKITYIAVDIQTWETIMIVTNTKYFF